MVLADGNPYLGMLITWMKGDQQRTTFGYCSLSTVILPI